MGKSHRLILSSILFSIILFFYVLNLVSFFQPTVYPFNNRVTFVTVFADKYFVNNLFDSLIIIACTILWFQFSLVKKKRYYVMAAFGISFLLVIFLNMKFEMNLLVLVSFPTLLIIIIANKILKKQIISFDWRLSLNYISVFGIAIAILSALLMIIYMLFPEIPLPSLNYLYYFFIILSILSPVYLLLVSFTYPFALTLRELVRKFREKNTHHNQESSSAEEKHIKRGNRIFHLSLIIILSITISMIPHLSTVNENNQVIGSDTKYYMRFLDSMATASSYGELLYKAFVTVSGGDRPFSVLIFFFMSSIFYQGNFYYLLEDLPLILSPLFMISIYFLTLGVTKNHFTSVLACLITIPSHILIGIYAGFYANWFALIWGYLAILFLFKLIDEPKKKYFIIFSLLLIILLFSHVQTWTILMYVFVPFLVLFLFKNRRKNKMLVLYAFVSILPSLILDITRMLLINTSGVKQELSFAAQREVGIHGLGTIWNNLIDTTHLHLAGMIANPIILLLVIYWIFSTKIKENYTLFFVIFFSLFVLPLLFADDVIQSRFFYMIPFQIPAAIALMAIKDKIGRFLPTAICLWLIVMSLYMAINFVLVVPQ